MFFRCELTAYSKQESYTKHIIWPLWSHCVLIVHFTLRCILWLPVALVWLWSLGSRLSSLLKFFSLLHTASIAWGSSIAGTGGGDWAGGGASSLSGVVKSDVFCSSCVNRWPGRKGKLQRKDSASFRLSAGKTKSRKEKKRALIFISETFILAGKSEKGAKLEASECF